MRYFLLIVFCFIFSFANAMSPIIDLRSAKYHIHEKFENADVIIHPYPHLCIEGILPEILYEQMQYFWPNSNCFSHQGGTNRHLYVTQGCTEWFPLTPDQKLFWRIYGEVVMRYVKSEIIKKLMPYLDWKFPWLSETELAQLKEQIEFTNSRQDGLMEHHYGYQIHPHIDQIYLLATGLLYCPKDNSQQQLSTLLFETPEEVPYLNYYRTENPVIEKAIPYKRNTLLVMLEHPWQYHGSAKHDVPGYIRKMYGIFVHVSPEQVEHLYQGHAHTFNLDWLYYQWEDRYMRFNPNG